MKEKIDFYDIKSIRFYSVFTLVHFICLCVCMQFIFYVSLVQRTMNLFCWVKMGMEMISPGILLNVKSVCIYMWVNVCINLLLFGSVCLPFKLLIKLY